VGHAAAKVQGGAPSKRAQHAAAKGGYSSAPTPIWERRAAFQAP
jgi:hypothetical protein